MKKSVFESTGSVADQLVLLLTSSDPQTLGVAGLGVAVLCAFVASTKKVFGRIPVVEKLSDGRKLSEIDVDEWCEGGIVAATVGWVLIACS